MITDKYLEIPPFLIKMHKPHEHSRYSITHPAELAAAAAEPTYEGGAYIGYTKAVISAAKMDYIVTGGYRNYFLRLTLSAQRSEDIPITHIKVFTEPFSSIRQRYGKDYNDASAEHVSNQHYLLPYTEGQIQEAMRVGGGSCTLVLPLEKTDSKRLGGPPFFLSCTIGRSIPENVHIIDPPPEVMDFLRALSRRPAVNHAPPRPSA